MHQPDRLHRSQLVRLLQHWAQPLAALERLDVAEQLSQWLGTVDAVQLSRALHALESAGPANASMQGAHVDVAALECGVRNLQEELAALPSQEALDRLCEINVLSNAENVARTTIVEDAWERGQPLEIHSWIYRLDTGRINVLDEPIGPK